MNLHHPREIVNMKWTNLNLNNLYRIVNVIGILSKLDEHNKESIEKIIIEIYKMLSKSD